MPGKAPAQPAVLDVEGGIARLMGNGGIYFKALKRFAAHIDAARAVAGQLAAGDGAGACRAIHTLKGAAGLLGAGEVEAIAARLETALARGSPVRAMLDDLDGALKRLQARIDAALQAPMPEHATAPAMATMPVAIRNVPALLDQVGELLGEGSDKAVDMLEKYAAVLEMALGTAAWKAIIAAARNCNFDSALATLQGARSSALR